MSTTETKRSHAQALADALAFMALFPASCYSRWEIAGSLRRGKAQVGDIEHLVTPLFGEVPVGDGLFSDDRKQANLLWHRCDELVTGGTLTKHVYGETGNRWGTLYRGCDFRGFNHEIWTAFPDNWGCQLVIRTGPAEFSQGVVDRFLRSGLYRQQDGYLVHVKSGSVVPVPDEETYFRLAGLTYLKPADRERVGVRS